VRLTKGDFSTQKIYNETPLDLARQYVDYGFEYLHLVDLDGAKSGKIVNHKILQSITSKCKLKVDFGGGIQSENDLKTAIDCGASQITGGSIAVKKPDMFLAWLEMLGSDMIILGADFMNGKIATNGWENASTQKLIPFIDSYFSPGIRFVISTDISKDGMLKGPAFGVYQKIISRVPVKLIASGGISSVADLEKLKAIGCEGVIVGKAIYEKTISLKELAEFNTHSNA
jgi:phosphoribosylformimino-5-aminoimidazole carboxamide ribotide isomerase